MIRVAIAGLGAVTRNLHLPAYSQLKRCVQLVAGCDPDSSALDWARRNGRVPVLFDNLHEMIERSRPDVVSVCTPPGLHREQTIAALLAGCHVFCEKPLAENLAHADEMISAADKAKRLVVVNSQFPCMAIHSGAKRLVGSPRFGRLRFLHASQTFHPTSKTEAGWRGELRRRVCFEFGIHVFELIRYFFEDDPVRIWSRMPTAIAGCNADLLNLIWVEFADGRLASILLNRISKGPEHYLNIHLDGEFASIHTFIGGRLRVEAGLYTRERRPFLAIDIAKGGKAVLQQGNRSELIAKDNLNPFASATARHFQEFVDAIERGRTPSCTALHNRKTLALVLAAYDSAEFDKPIELAPYYQSPAFIAQSAART